MKKNIWRNIRKVWALLGLCIIGWMWFTFQAQHVDASIFESDTTLEVTASDDLISFTPKEGFDKVLLFYPGGMVAPEAYAPLCRQIAESGCQVQLIKMPWRLATKGYNKPKELDLLADTTFEYILAGHSQGAKMAAQFVYENPSLIDKLILIGTTHPRDINLSSIGLPIMKISGTNDGIASMEKVLENKPKLPEHTRFVTIEGANHSQFGHYGFQFGDDKADISREEQQKQVVEYIQAFILNQPMAAQ
ncbi:alpha/beta hydrolase [Limibacter armeniacum]|uniref:alpha/beta hydrolase n=1 Tax=Limibacter armeniacum TaxID=466084 RepID=UPI002FE5AA06